MSFSWNTVRVVDMIINRKLLNMLNFSSVYKIAGFMYSYTKVTGGEWKILIFRLKGLINTTLFKALNILTSLSIANEYRVKRAPISKDSKDNFLMSRMLTK